MTTPRRLLPYLLVPALPLLVPLLAMRFTAEVHWTGSDFAVAYLLLAGTGLAYRLLTSRAGGRAYRAAAGLAVATGLLLVWGNLAVGFIGSEQHPANRLYAGVLALGVIGAGLARGEPRGMASTLAATAVAQGLVPVLAWVVWPEEPDLGSWHLWVYNSGLALLFAGSAVLFRRAANSPAPAAGEAPSAP